MNWKYTTGDIVIYIFDKKKYKVLNYTRQGGINYYLIPHTGYLFVEEKNLIDIKSERKIKINKIDKL